MIFKNPYTFSKHTDIFKMIERKHITDSKSV